MRIAGLECGSRRYHERAMSEHTDRIDDLAKRIASAKEFL